MATFDLKDRRVTRGDEKLPRRLANATSWWYAQLYYRLTRTERYVLLQSLVVISEASPRRCRPADHRLDSPGLPVSPCVDPPRVRLDETSGVEHEQRMG